MVKVTTINALVMSYAAGVLLQKAFYNPSLRGHLQDHLDSNHKNMEDLVQSWTRTALTIGLHRP